MGQEAKDRESLQGASGQLGHRLEIEVGLDSAEIKVGTMSGLLKDCFAKRKKDPPIVSAVGVLLGQGFPSTPKHGVESRILMDASTMSKPESDFRDFRALSAYWQRYASRLVLIGCKSTMTENWGFALALGSNGNAQLMTSIIEKS